MKTHHKLSSRERDQIAYWRAIGVRIREIARRLGRSPSSISDEVKRNRIDGIYHSIHAHKASEARKRSCHKKYLLMSNIALQSYVLEKLDCGWSPEQIAGRLRREIKEGKRPSSEYINHESIYQWVYDENQRTYRLWEKLARSHKKRQRWLGDEVGKPRFHTGFPSGSVLMQLTLDKSLAIGRETLSLGTSTRRVFIQR
jgi:transposase, IS30 family